METIPLLTLNTNKIILSTLLLVLIFNQKAIGQVLGQDSNGFSSIVLPSSNLNIDGANNVITISYVQLHRLIKDDKNRERFSVIRCFHENSDAKSIKKCIEEKWNINESKYSLNNSSILYGLELKGTSKNGLGIILDEELLANSGSINGVVGYHFKNKRHNRKSLENYVELKTKHKNLMDSIRIFKTIITTQVTKMITDGVITKEKGNNKLLNFTTKKEIPDIINEIQARIHNLNHPKKPSIDNIKRLKEINTQINILSQALKNVNGVLTKFDTFPKIATISDSNLDYLHNSKRDVEFMLKELNRKDNFYNIFSINIELENYVDKKTWDDAQKALEKSITYLRGEKNQLKSLSKSSIDNYVAKLIDLYTSFLGVLEKLEKANEDLDKLINKQIDYNRHYFYGKLGFIGKSFMYDLNNEASTLDARTEERNFQGTRFEIGWTHQLKSYNFFGINISKNYTDNSSYLTSKTFQFKTIDNTVTPSLEIQDEITVLSGPYDRFHNYQMSFDYARLISLNDKNVKDNKTSKVYLSLNPYFRHNFYSDSETLKPNTSFGLGMYAFNTNKNSIAGGFFIQADDVFNSNREDSLNFTKQIKIGLVFKYSLSSFTPK